MKHYAKTETPIGTVWIGEENNAVCSLCFSAPEPGSSIIADVQKIESLQQCADWLSRYFAGENPDPEIIQVNPEGSPFQKAVWQELRNIPYGEVTTYKKIARALSETRQKNCSAQAVGQALKNNPISILIPCHRVVGTGGNLTGYAGGIEKKIALLELEGIDTAWFALPKEKKWQKI